jgi:hypothetical protein
MADTYNYDAEMQDFDTADFKDLGNTDWYDNGSNTWKSGSYETPQQQYQPPEMNNTWGAGGYQQGQDGTQYWQNQQGNYTGYMPQGGEYTPYGQQQDGMDWGDMGSKALKGLQSLFKGSTSQNLGALLAGYMSDQRNKKTGAAAQSMIQQQARPYDQQGTTGAQMAGASSMRDAAQQQQVLAQQKLDQFRANPSSDAGYKAQMDQILQAQQRVAAARGVRFNPESAQGAMSPATLSALAQNQMTYDKNYQNDRNSYFTPAGAGMSGGLSEMLAAMQQQSKGDYYSGLAGGAGFTSANQMNDPDFLARVLQAQQQLKG